jgi:hypothetical protein
MAVQRQIAVSVQRGNADIMIRAAQHARDAVLHSRRVRVRTSRAMPPSSSASDSASPWPVRSKTSRPGLHALQRAASLPLPSVLSGAAASSSGAAPSVVNTVTMSADVPPSPVGAVLASPSAGGGVGVGPAVSVPAAAHASTVLRTCSALDAMSSGMGGRASDARSALDALVGALDVILAERSALSAPGAA